MSSLPKKKWNHLSMAKTAGKCLWKSKGNIELAKKYLTEELFSLPGVSTKIAQILSYSKNLESSQNFTPVLTQAKMLELLVKRSSLLTSHTACIYQESCSASIGQVMHIGLKNKQELAVKIQYPGIRHVIQEQLDYLFKQILVYGPQNSYAFDKEEYERYFRKKFQEETNYLCELKNQKDFHQIWSSEENIIIPDSFENHSTDLILVQSWCKATRFSRSTANKQHLAKLLSRFTFDSLFLHGILHADISPENIQYHENKLVIFDFGQVIRLTPIQLEAMKTLVGATESEIVFRSLVQLGFNAEKLQSVRNKLGDLNTYLFRPFWDKCNSDNYSPKKFINTLLGEEKWWFRTAGPPWFFYLLKSLYGFYTLHQMLSFDLDFSYISSLLVLPKRKSNPCYSTNPERPKVLQIIVLDENIEKVKLSFPVDCINRLEEIIPEDVMAKIENEKISIESIKNKAYSSQYMKQVLFELSYPRKKVTISIA